MANALTRLADAVEAGTLHLMPYGGMPMATAVYPRDADGHMTGDVSGWSDGAAVSAYHGSINDAERLHRMAVPTWDWSVHGNGQAALWPSGSIDEQNAGVIETEIDGYPARAWLLAILRAMAQVQK